MRNSSSSQRTIALTHEGSIKFTLNKNTEISSYDFPVLEKLDSLFRNGSMSKDLDNMNLFCNLHLFEEVPTHCHGTAAQIDPITFICNISLPSCQIVASVMSANRDKQYLESYLTFSLGKPSKQ